MRIKRMLACAALTPVAMAGAGRLLQRAGHRRDARRFPPPGLLLSRRGRYLHILQQGSGRPAVVFEAGLAATSLSWSRVQPLAAQFSATASYDRAGLGWSSLPTSPLRLTEMLDDLHGAITWTGRGAPVVLVGHSFGALLALAYAERFPLSVAGLVLIDPLSFTAWTEGSGGNARRLQVGARLSRRGAWLAEFGVVRAALFLLLHGGQQMAQRIGRRAAGPAAATLERLTGEIGKLPRDLWPVVAAQWSAAKSFRTMAATLDALPGCVADAGHPVLPAELPVAILSAASATPEELRERDGWLAAPIDKQHRVVAGTGHWMHLERPDEVAAAIRWCAERAKLREVVR